MDNSLVHATKKNTNIKLMVLILVVMDNSLVPPDNRVPNGEAPIRLNPCCNGQ